MASSSSYDTIQNFYTAYSAILFPDTRDIDMRYLMQVSATITQYLENEHAQDSEYDQLRILEASFDFRVLYQLAKAIINIVNNVPPSVTL